MSKTKTQPKRKTKTPKCRCYINSKFYAKAAATGSAAMKGYIPCPIHEKPEDD